MIVSANPRPGHGQLEYYKKSNKNGYYRHSRDGQDNRRGRQGSPWAQGYSGAKSIYSASPLFVMMFATIIKIVYG